MTGGCDTGTSITTDKSLETFPGSWGLGPFSNINVHKQNRIQINKEYFDLIGALINGLVKDCPDPVTGHIVSTNTICLQFFSGF